MKQQTLAADQETGFEQHRKPTAARRLLGNYAQIVPWAQLCAIMEPITQSAAMTGRRLG